MNIMTENSTNVTLQNLTSDQTCSSQADFGETFKQMKVIIDVYFMMIIIMVGLFGNLLSFYILRQIDNREVQTYFLLSCLAIADSFYLVSCIFFQIISTLYTFFENVSGSLPWFPIMQVITWPIANVSQMAAVWMVVLVSLDRYLVICFPFTNRWALTRKSAKLLVLLVVICSVVFNCTTMFEQEITDRRDRCPNITKVDVTVTALYRNGTYQLVYKTILTFIVRTAAPFCLLLFMNLRLAGVMHKTINYHARLRGEVSNKETLNRTVIAVVIVFLLCLSPNLIYAIIRTIMVHMQDVSSLNWDRMAYFSVFVNMALTMNSAANFLIYCVTGRRFRRKLREIIHGKHYEKPQGYVDIPLVDLQ